MQTATSEIDGFANIRPDAIGADDSTFHSGVAINYLQKAGIAELGSFILAYRAWKLRVYRTVWNIVKRTWNQERFIRVGTDDTQKLIQINGFGKDQFGRPGFINVIGDIEVEIVLDEGPDNANLMQDAFETLSHMPPGTVPPGALIELMPLADSIKQKIIKMMSQPPAPDPAVQAKIQAAQIGAQTAQARGQAEIAKAHMATQANAAATQAEMQNNAADLQLERERANAERASIALQMQERREEHVFKMRELAAQEKHRNAQRAKQNIPRRNAPIKATA
jgi:hypothetical protein